MLYGDKGPLLAPLDSRLQHAGMTVGHSEKLNFKQKNTL